MRRPHRARHDRRCTGGPRRGGSRNLNRKRLLSEDRECANEAGAHWAALGIGGMRERGEFRNPDASLAGTCSAKAREIGHQSVVGLRRVRHHQAVAHEEARVQQHAHRCHNADQKTQAHRGPRAAPVMHKPPRRLNEAKLSSRSAWACVGSPTPANCATKCR